MPSRATSLFATRYAATPSQWVLFHEIRIKHRDLQDETKLTAKTRNFISMVTICVSNVQWPQHPEPAHFWSGVLCFIEDAMQRIILAASKGMIQPHSPLDLAQIDETYLWERSLPLIHAHLPHVLTCRQHMAAVLQAYSDEDSPYDHLSAIFNALDAHAEGFGPWVEDEDELVDDPYAVWCLEYTVWLMICMAQAISSIMGDWEIFIHEQIVPGTGGDSGMLRPVADLDRLSREIAQRERAPRPVGFGRRLQENVRARFGRCVRAVRSLKAWLFGERTEDQCLIFKSCVCVVVGCV